MIHPHDCEFHPVAPSNWRWTETTPLSFSVPEAAIRIAPPPPPPPEPGYAVPPRPPPPPEPPISG